MTAAMRRVIAFAIILCMVCYWLQITELLAVEQANVVVVLCDDHVHCDLECYSHPHLKTPNLNSMAEQGIRFSDFYYGVPVCSPSHVDFFRHLKTKR